jgi:hypothetical protein
MNEGVMLMNKIVYLLVCIPLILAGCGVLQIPKQMDFSFEKDMEGWIAKGTDLGNPADEWSIERSEEMATNGSTSLKVYLNNLNGSGKIWIERPFDVEPNSYYQVNVEYDFASNDYGDLNLWTVITGALLGPPTTADELVYQRDTGNGADKDDGYKWLHKTYGFDMRTGPEKEIIVIIGIWGTWETARNYYIDNVKIRTIKS